MVERSNPYSLQLIVFLVSVFMPLVALTESWAMEEKGRDKRPNILLIVADDAGYSDIGCFGSEIPTPNLDRLAFEGVRFTQFHVTPNCAPTRAALFAGMDYHRAGLGTMPEVASSNQKGKPGYEGYLNFRVISLAEALQNAGYHTYMTGKWHLGAKDSRTRPEARGFEEAFAMLAGGASHWPDNKPLIPGKMSPYSQGGQLVKELPKDFYSTKDYTDRMIEFINKNKDDGRPFFGYLSYTAPHNPLHAPKAYIEKFKGNYKMGWDTLAEMRLSEMKRLALVSDSTVAHPRPKWVKAWNDLKEDQKRLRARDMEVYAAMINYMDHSIGRLFHFLKEIGAYDNTLIIFFSDNGASKTTIEDYARLGGEMAEYLKSFDNSLENRGLADSSTDIGPGWAYAANTPFRLTKGYVTQGGVISPCVVKLPGHMSNAGRRIEIFTHVIDIMPTALNIAGVEPLQVFKGREVLPLQGKSILPLLRSQSGQAFSERGIGWELYGMRAYRKGDWKAVKLPRPYGTGKWQLYNLAEDPSERYDLAKKNPNKLKNLIEQWEQYAKENRVIEPEASVGYAKPPRKGSF